MVFEGQGVPKSWKNASKNGSKTSLEKTMQKGAKNDRKGTQNGGQNPSKIGQRDQRGKGPNKAKNKHRSAHTIIGPFAPCKDAFCTDSACSNFAAAPTTATNAERPTMLLNRQTTCLFVLDGSVDRKRLILIGATVASQP